jgi:hypothetical protein
MTLFSFLTGKNKGYASPWLNLTIVYATSPDGLAPEHAFALRGKVMSAAPIYFEFIKSGAYLACFAGTHEGLHAGNRLAEELRIYGREKAVPNFGVGALQGECLAQMSGNRLKTKPVGVVIAQAMEQALAEANAR